MTAPQIAEPEPNRIDEGTASVAVHNKGDPIPSDMFADLFEPMVRGATSNTTVRSIGLGLFIVREIARAHGGTMVVSSSAGEGTP